MNSWWFRMKPRSILRTIEWFPSFAKLEGRDWNEKDENRLSAKTGKPVSTTRREYIYDAHGEDFDISFDDFMSGKYDSVDVESAARNDKISFEFFGFGYVDSDNIVRVTDVGRVIVEGRMNDEYLLKQLLKLQFSSPIIKKKFKNGGHVFPMEVLLKSFEKFDYLSHLEVALLFGCINIEELNKTLKAIEKFRIRYSNIENKLKTKEVIDLYTEILNDTYPEIDNKPVTYLDYADAFIRSITYTGLFLTRGRGIHTKLYIPEHSKTKVRLLQSKYKFVYNDEEDFDLFMKYFGDPYNVKLPWDNPDDRKTIVENKLKDYRLAVKKIKKVDENLIIEDLLEIENLVETRDYRKLVVADEKLTESLLSINEKIFIKLTSKTKEAREEIIEKFEDIKSGNDDMAALWLEVNTWKSLIAINGEHRVKRNFKIEEDLTPKSFAIGAGNTPDMEVYLDEYVLIPEVSMMSGVRQWEHEGSSVIDHVLKFIEKYEDRDVYGLFISKSINVRTMWQFFILNRESWVGRNVPVIPITIDQYVDIISFLYENELDIFDFTDLILKISKNALQSENYRKWETNIVKIIKEWKVQTLGNK